MLSGFIIALLVLPAARAQEARAIPSQAWGDFDGDELEDVYVRTPGAPDRLFENVGDGTFVDVTDAAGLTGLVGSRAAEWGDADGDGVLDLLLVTARGGLALFRGIGNARFEDHSRAAEIGSESGVLAADWFDYDHDGRMDLLLETSGGSRLLHNSGGVFDRVELGPPWQGKAIAGPPPAADPVPPPTDPLEPDRASQGSGHRPRASVNTRASAASPGNDVSGSAPPIVATSITNCVHALEDQANQGTCIGVSTVPTLGLLFPLGPEFNIDAATGNAGIGTVAPDARLQVSGASLSSDVTHFLAASSASTRLGLMVEHANGSHPFDAFSIASLYRRTAVSGNGNTLQFDMNNASGARANFARLGATVENATPGAESGSFGFWTVDAGALARRVTIQSDGQVGIGTATPSVALDVVGDARMDGFHLSTGAGAGRVLTSDASGRGTWQASAGVPSGSMILGSTQVPPPGFSYTGFNPVLGDQWISVANLPLSRSNFACAAVNGSVYAIGGRSINGPVVTLTDVVERYNPVTNGWGRVAPMLQPREGHAAAAVGGSIYVVGGRFGKAGPLAILQKYDPVLNKWTGLKSMPAPRAELAVATVNGKIYAIGGRNAAGNSLGTNEEYDPLTDAWKPRAALPNPVHLLSACAVNGKVYVIGGIRGTTTENKVFEYDPGQDVWAQKNVMPTARSGLAAAVAGGKILAIGGQGTSGGPLFTVEEFDPANDTWTGGPTLRNARSSLAAAELNGNVYAVGGVIVDTLRVVEELPPAVRVYLHQKN